MATKTLENEKPTLPASFPRSPLRYPGGKSRAAGIILSHVPPDTKDWFSPFFGGGSVELAASHRGIRVAGADSFGPLVCFWSELFTNAGRLADRCAEYLSIMDREAFYELQSRLTSITDPLEQAAAFFVLNRSSFSGTTLSGGMSPGHPRFTPSAVERVRSFNCNRINIECGDFTETIPKYPNHFLYCDPPYWIRQKLYGDKGDRHSGFNHAGLADLLKRRGNWILSYNDGDEIRRLYSGFRIEPVAWVYGMGKSKRSSEILIFSDPAEPGNAKEKT